VSRYDRFHGAAAGFMTLYSVLSVLVQELGPERAIDILRGAMEEFGGVCGRSLLGRAGTVEAPIDAQMAFPLLATVTEAVGTDATAVDVSPTEVTYQVGMCSSYRAAKSLGWSDDLLAAFCRAGQVCAMNAAAKELNPRLSVTIERFRTTADEPCVERIVLEED
jgi:hypothetical protein